MAIPAKQNGSTEADDPSTDNHDLGDGNPPPLGYACDLSLSQQNSIAHHTKTRWRWGGGVNGEGQLSAGGACTS